MYIVFNLDDICEFHTRSQLICPVSPPWPCKTAGVRVVTTEHYTFNESEHQDWYQMYRKIWWQGHYDIKKA